MVRLRTPGPGSYDVPTGMSIGSNTDRPSATFASNTKRTGSIAKKDTSGDPGQYNTEQASLHLGSKEPLSARSRRSFNRDSGTGRGSFNSTTKRCAPPRVLVRA